MSTDGLSDYIDSRDQDEDSCWGCDKNVVAEHSCWSPEKAIETMNESLELAEFLPSAKHPDFPEFAIETVRLQTFDEWPKTLKQRPKQLSDAGFFYTQKGDRVICFSCGGGLCDWVEQDDPWEQHAIWYDKCEYLRLVKGFDFINAVHILHCILK